MRKIGIENFRVFKDMTEFELRPLTLLTGPNNSGKSSFSKFLLLLNNGIEALDFTKGDHNLNDFEKERNWNNQQNKTITLRLQAPGTLPFDFCMDLIYKGNKGGWEDDCGINIHNNETSLIKIYKSTATTDMEAAQMCDFDWGEIDECNEEVNSERMYITSYDIQIDFNIKLFIDLIYTKRIRILQDNNKGWTELASVQQDLTNEAIERINTNNFKETKEFGDHKYVYQLRNLALSNTIDSLEINYLLYNVYIDGKMVSNEAINEVILKTQEEAYKFYTAKYYDIGELYNESLSYTELIRNAFSGDGHLSMNGVAKEMVLKNIKEIFYSNNEVQIKVTESVLGQLIFEQKLFSFYQNEEWDYPEFHDTLLESIAPVLGRKTASRQYISPFSVYKISANRGSQKRILQNKGENEMDAVVAKWASLPAAKQHRKLLQKILSILEIEGEFDVRRIENTISVAYLKSAGKEINLVDLGFGYSQIIVLVLKLIVISNYGNYGGIVIIEEPEANLHPNLQSKLADVFTLFINAMENGMNSKFDLVIESHSEYLIRKLQNLVVVHQADEATKDVKKSLTNVVNIIENLKNIEFGKIGLSPENVVIYYFNDDKYVSETETKVKKIEIRENGELSKNFGKGFLDESAYLNLSLYNLSKDLKN